MEKSELNSGENVKKNTKLELSAYNLNHFLCAVLDLSAAIDNPYFKAPFTRCSSCNKGSYTIMAHFGHGGANKIGNLKGLQASVGDIIGWHSDSFSGISVVRSKSNGVFELESENFPTPRKEPAMIDRLIVPEKHRPLLREMALYLANKEKYGSVKTAKIGKGDYPSAIAKKL